MPKYVLSLDANKVKNNLSVCFVLQNEIALF